VWSCGVVDWFGRPLNKQPVAWSDSWSQREKAKAKAKATATAKAKAKATAKAKIEAKANAKAKDKSKSKSKRKRKSKSKSKRLSLVTHELDPRPLWGAIPHRATFGWKSLVWDTSPHRG